MVSRNRRVILLQIKNPATSSLQQVDYVLGEVYWKCEVGETVRAMRAAMDRGRQRAGLES